MKKILSLILTLLIIFNVMPVFADDAPFKAGAGELLPGTGKYTYTDWNGAAHEVDLYTVELPEGTEELSLSFPESVLAFNYGFTGEGDPSVTDDNYLSSGYDESMAGAAEGTVTVDSDSDGIPDFIQVQTLYDENWNSEVLYAITFSVPGMEAVHTEGPAVTYSAGDLAQAAKKTAAYLIETVPEPVSGDVGGEWVILGLARSGEQIPAEYFRKYRDALSGELKTNNGKPDERKYTEYSRMLLALSALGIDSDSAEAAQLVEKLSDSDAVISQGLNGPVWALIALNAADSMPGAGGDLESVAQQLRPVYLQKILSAQNPDGGFAIAGSESDVDMTAMVLQALAGFEGEDAEAALEKALDFLSGKQNPDGGFTSFGSTGSESVSRVIMALNENAVSLEDPRFVKNGNTLTANLMGFALEDGAFAHVKGGSANQISTEQAMMALAGTLRLQNGGTRFFDMSDVRPAVPSSEPLSESAAEAAGTTGAAGLAGKNTKTAGIILIAAALLVIVLAVKLLKKTVKLVAILVAAAMIFGGGTSIFRKTEAPSAGACTISISCATVLDNMDKLAEEKAELVPENGLILAPLTVTFAENETVSDLLRRICRSEKIHLEAEYTAVTGSTFVEGIGNIYELDAGPLSGWKYSVNGEFPGYGCSSYTLKDGDVVQWLYTCDMGADIGAGNVEGNN